MRQILITFLLLGNLHAQQPIGDWVFHMTAQDFNWVGETENWIYAANNHGVLSLNRSSRERTLLSKTNVLTESSITCFKCFQDPQLCVIGYESGNLDFIDSNGNVSNQPALKASQVVGSKQVNDAAMQGGQLYVATDFGVLRINPRNFTILGQTEIAKNSESTEIHCFAMNGDQFVFANADGVFRSDLADGIQPAAHIAFPSNASHITELWAWNNGTYITYKSSTFKEDTIYQIVGDSVSVTNLALGQEINSVYATDSLLFLAQGDNATFYDTDFNYIEHIFTYGEGSINCHQALISEYDNRVYAADGLWGLASCTRQNQFDGEEFYFLSPPKGFLSELSAVGDSIIAMPGGNERTYNLPILSVFANNEWESIELVDPTNPNFRNGNECIAFGDKLALAADRGGLAVLTKNLEIETVYNEHNSPIEDYVPNSDYDYYGITSVQTDDNGSLYVAHNLSEKPLKIKTADDGWLSIGFEDIGTGKPLTGQLLRHSSGILFLAIPETGIAVFDPGASLTSTNDDRTAFIGTTEGNGNLPNSKINALIEDQNGEVWIGTDEGVSIIYTPENAFEPGFEVDQVIVSQDGYNGLLFESEAVMCLAVDGANRKWVGTAHSGAFLVSADGTEQIHSFNTDNSPLLSNDITSIAINPSSGEVFFAADEGIVSYRSNATAGAENLDNAIAFPNPAALSKHPVINFAGLAADSQVKITDQSGSLVAETLSLGGTAQWNIKSAQVPIEPGIYHAHCYSANGDYTAHFTLLVKQ